MTDLEKAEKLREKTGVSYTEAKEALDNTDGSILEALVYLEKQGRVEMPSGGGFYSGAEPYGAESHGDRQIKSSHRRNNADSGTEAFADLMRRFGKFCLSILHKASTNYLKATKDGQHLFSCPVIIFVLLLVIFFWVTLPVYIISLFCGIRYRFSGPDLERDAVNKVMDSASDLVDDVKKSFAEEIEKDE